MESSLLLGLTVEGLHVFSVRNAKLNGKAVRCFYGEASLEERGAVAVTPSWIESATIADRYPAIASLEFDKKLGERNAVTMTRLEQVAFALLLSDVKDKKVPNTGRACP
jgi:hypothetical protein